MSPIPTKIGDSFNLLFPAGEDKCASLMCVPLLSTLF